MNRSGKQNPYLFSRRMLFLAITILAGMLMALALWLAAARAAGLAYAAGGGKNARQPATFLSGAFPAAGLDEFASVGSFKIVLLNGPEIFVLGLHDPATVIGRSDPFTEGVEDPAGHLVAGGGAPPYPNTLALVPDPCIFPANFPEEPDTRREVHTEMLTLQLEGVAVVDSQFITVSVKAGQPYYDSASPLARQVFYRNSTGEVASLYDGEPQNFNQDFPADSFFDVFVQVTVGWPINLKLYNVQPMVVRSMLTEFPPSFQLPYLHLSPVPLYNEYGSQVGYVTSVAHGDEGSGGGLPILESPSLLTDTVMFAVDDMSIGLPPPLSPLDHVWEDQGQPEQQVTVYQSSGAHPGLGPDGTNARVPELTGTVATPPQFVAGDALNSLSLGRDGMNITATLPLSGALYFSIGRDSQGYPCSHVRYDAGAAIPRQASAIYVSRVARSLDLYPGPVARFFGEDNLLHAVTVGATALGLRPSTLDTGQDNLTGMEISSLQGDDWLYGTFTGPTFAGDGGTIFAYDPDSGPFIPGNLIIYSTPANLGLDPADVIDALALADVTVMTGTVVAIPNGLLDPNADEILFSLAPGSPSLATGSFSAADIFVSGFAGTFAVAYQAEELGLLPTDNIDAIDIGLWEALEFRDDPFCFIEIGEPETGNQPNRGQWLEASQQGEVFTYTLTITNHGTVAVTNVLISNTISGGDYVPGSASDGGTYITATHTIMWNLDSLASDTVIFRSFSVTPAADVITNIYSVWHAWGKGIAGEPGVTIVRSTIFFPILYK